MRYIHQWKGSVKSNRLLSSLMSAKSVEVARRKLRLEVTNSFPNLSPLDIYERIKKKERPDIFFDDLESYCNSALINSKLLPDIFSCYNVSSPRVKKDRFIKFLADGVGTCDFQPEVPSSLSEEQVAILDRFCKTLKSRKTQGLPVFPCSGVSERSSLSNLWTSLCRMSPQREKLTHVRLAALCQIASELNMSFTSEEFLDALFNFFGTTLDAIDFQQFAHLMETF